MLLLQRVHRQVHDEASGDQCNICFDSFSSGKELKRHRNSKHSNRQFACPHCPHRSKTLEKQAKHLACHLAKESFSCDFCNKTFAFKNSLKKHQSKGRCEGLKQSGNAVSRTRKSGSKKSEKKKKNSSPEQSGSGSGSGDPTMTEQLFGEPEMPNFMTLDLDSLFF